MTKLFDTHAHYTDERLKDKTGLIESIFDGDVGYITCVASSIEDSMECIALAEKYENMYASAGIHPHECENRTDVDADMQAIERLCGKEKVIALGEIGLDYHYDKEFEAAQKKYFDAQLSLAESLDIPVIIHDRDAHGDVFDMICAHKRARGIIHSCSESAEMVKEYVRRGWYISFSGVITFKNASKILEAVNATPKDRILVETDCPYLSPVPMRGTDNSSANLHFTAAKAAETLGMDYGEFVKISTENAKRVFMIED
ncbi:MAG: TatD family hydrolase [Clostridiales bacterium]|nr:TatD family hydrolase [Clostridiales bacterium]